ncbi:MAG: portal protein, partial [Paracoccaceae bacterium]
NYLITDEMEDYDPDMDQMLFYLPLAGSSFKKVYYDVDLGRPVAKFVPAEDLVVPYLSTDLNTAERVTHVVKMTKNEIRKAQVAGLYRDISLEDPYDEESKTQEKYNDIQGVDKPVNADMYNLLEIHCDLDIEGFEDRDEQTGEPTGIKIPYVVTIEEGSGKILAIYRNYKQDDPFKRKIEYFVHYKFLPGLGFYGFGLIHMLGGLSRTATSALRQLIDAGTLSNLPAGFKARGLRIRDDDNPLQPGEFRDVDAPSGDLRNGLLPLPYKGPDQTLFALLGFVVDAGRRFAAIADQKLGEGSQANPVGTTMALLEQGSKVMSAIHKRLHYAQKKEFRILGRIIADFLPPEYPYMVAGGNRMIKQQDFDDRIDIIPVSDPTIFSMAQRITLAQTQLQLAQSNPQIHNLYEAYRRMYQAMGVQQIDQILPPPPQPQPMDPAMENSMVLMQKPLQAFPEQDHIAHIDAHRAFISSYLVKNTPNIMALLQSHISQHISFVARQEIEAKNAPIFQQQAAQFGGQLPPELMQQFQMQNEKEIAARIAELTNEMVAEEQEYLEGMTKDPLVTLKEQELGLRAEELELRAQKDGEKQALEEQKAAVAAQQNQEKIDNADKHATIREGISLAKLSE